jgi:hypothetical protein
LTCGSAIALAIGASVLTAGIGAAAAQPGPGGSGGHDQGPRRMGTTRDTHAAARVDPVGPVDRLLPGGPSPGDHNPAWGPPPPDQGWRGIDDGRRDHQPFNYNGSWVTPIYNPDFNNRGFWFFGIWIAL